MKKFDVTVKLKNGRETVDVFLNDIEAEDEKTAKILALSYAKDRVHVWVDSIKENNDTNN